MLDTTTARTFILALVGKCYLPTNSILVLVCNCNL